MRVLFSCGLSLSQIVQLACVLKKNCDLPFQVDVITNFSARKNVEIECRAFIRKLRHMSRWVSRKAFHPPFFRAGSLRMNESGYPREVFSAVLLAYIEIYDRRVIERGEIGALTCHEKILYGRNTYLDANNASSTWRKNDWRHVLKL